MRSLARWPRLLALGLAVLSFENARAKEPEAEIKLFVGEGKIDEALKQIKKDFSLGAPKKHEIYFFDTAALSLYENGAGPVILRARKKDDDEPQSTVKLRRDKRDPKLEKKLGEISPKFEIQMEWIAGRKGPPGISYALDAKWENQPLSNLEGASSQTISGWFTPKQKEFLEAAGVKVEWGDLEVFGRVDADVWQWEEKDKLVAAKITAELWPLGDKRIFELSCKKPGEGSPKEVENFEAFFKARNILAAENPPSKTKQALDYFSKKANPQSKPTAAATADR